MIYSVVTIQFLSRLLPAFLTFGVFYCLCCMLFTADSIVMDSAVPERQGLYDPANEHDACGVGFVAHIKGQKSHSIIEQGLLILKNLDHRGAVGADPLMGDGAGILIQIPDGFFREEMATQGVTLPRAGDYGIRMVFLPKESASRLACKGNRACRKC